MLDHDELQVEDQAEASTHDDTPTPARSSRASRSFAAAGSIAVIAFLALDGRGATRGWILVGTLLAAIVAGAIGALRYGWANGPRALFLLGMACLVPAYVLWLPATTAGWVTLGSPSPADALFLSGYACFLGALFRLIRLRGGAHRVVQMLDTLIMSTGLGVLVWLLIIAPYVHDGAMSGLGKAVAASYPVVDLLLFGAVVRLLASGRTRSPAFWLLTAWAVTQLLADMIYASTVLRGSFTLADRWIGLYALSFVLLGAALLHPSMRTLSDPIPERRPPSGLRRLALMGLAALVAPLSNMVLGIQGDSGSRVVVAAFAAVLFILVLARVGLLMVDVDEHRKIQEQLARSNAELEQFAYVASHDLQEPLRKVSSFCQLLERRYKGQLDDQADQYIEFVVDGASRMQVLINDLLAYSRLGRQDLVMQPVPLDAAVQRALANLEAAVEDSGAEILVRPLPTVLGNESQLAQLFQNLVGNAIKFRGDAPPRIVVSAEQRDGVVRVQVADNGIGIEPQYLDRIFRVFQRLHTRAEYPGTGIGLAICMKIAERHGGQLTVTSTPGVGTTFHLNLEATKGERQ